MRYSVPEAITEFANRVAHIPFAKAILKPFYYSYKHLLRRKRNSHFRKYALETLKDFDECLESNGFEYTLAFGTLLGAVREKGFIKHDLDIDVAMWSDEYSNVLKECLQKSGFSLLHSFEIDGGDLGREETYVKNDISIDVFYFYPAIDKYPYCCDFVGQEGCPTYRKCMEKYGGALPRRIEIPMTKERVRTTFEDTEFFIPINANEILAFRYGEDYMTPRKDWTINSNDSHIVYWTEKKGIYRGA